MKVSKSSMSITKRIVGKKDLGKKNAPGKTGFNTVAKKASAEYGSTSVGKQVAGSIFQKMRKKGSL